MLPEHCFKSHSIKPKNVILLYLQNIENEESRGATPFKLELDFPKLKNVILAGYNKFSFNHYNTQQFDKNRTKMKIN